MLPDEMNPLQLSDFQFDLPTAHIAQHPVTPRDSARLMVVKEQTFLHRHVFDLPALLQEHVGQNALLVVNNTQVIPARLFAKKKNASGQPGARVELLLSQCLYKEKSPFTWTETWQCFAKSNKPLRADTHLILEGNPSVSVCVSENNGLGRVSICFSGTQEEGLLPVLQQIGHMPLPPYIHREQKNQEDAAQYQTIFAKEQGAIAAPTAGLHFTPDLVQHLQDAGFSISSVTLHVGAGTFSPVKTQDLAAHDMHQEFYNVPQETVQAIATARAQGRKIVAIGTTVVRTLESATPPGETVPTSGPGSTQLFVRPPYSFRCVDAMLTNFHLPASTLLMLVCAFAGYRRTLAAYDEAIKQGYRFFSYGDAMLIPQPLPEGAF